MYIYVNLIYKNVLHKCKLVINMGYRDSADNLIGLAKTNKDRKNTGSMNIPKGIVRKFSFENKREDSSFEVELVKVGDI